MKKKTKKIITTCLLVAGASTLGLGATNIEEQIPYANALEDKYGTPFEIDKNKIEDVNILTDSNLNLKIGESANLSVKVFPEVAEETLENVSFQIVRGLKNASIVNNTLQINDEATIGETIEVVALVDGVASSNSLLFKVDKTAVEEIVILNTETELAQGSMLELKTQVFPENATNTNCIYTVLEGREYLTVNPNGVVIVNGNLNGENMQATIKVESCSDPQVSKTITFNLTKPSIDTIIATTKLAQVEQGRKYSFMNSAEDYKEIFGENQIYYTLNVNSNIATIDKNGLLTINEAAPVNSVIVVYMRTANGKRFNQTLVVEPVYATKMAITNFTKPAHSEGYYPGEEIEINVDFIEPFNVSDINKNYYIRMNPSTLAIVTDKGIKIKNANEITTNDKTFTVTVYSNQNGNVLSETLTFTIYVPITNIVLTQKETVLKENTSFNLSDIITTNIDTAISDVGAPNFQLVDSTYATLHDNELIIKDNLPEGDLNIELFAIADNAVSNVLTFNLYKPTRSLTLTTDNVNPISRIAGGETVNLFTAVSKTASVNNPIFTVIKGVENIDPSFLNGNQVSSSFKVKANLSEVKNLNKQIVIKAKQDDKESIIDLFVYIPNEKMNISLDGLTRGEYNDFSISYSQNADDMNYEIIEQSQAVEVFDKNGQTIKIKKNASAGTEVKIKYRSLDRLKTEFTQTFKVDSLISDRSETVLKDNINQMNMFNFILDSDSEGIPLNLSNPQLHVGRFTDIVLKYSGKALEEYGLTIESISVNCFNNYFNSDELNNDKIFLLDNASAIKLNNGIRLSVSNNAIGKTQIVCNVIVKDGDTSYILVPITFETFKPMNGTPVVLNNSITNIETSLNLGYGDFEKYANYNLNSLEYKSSNLNGASISPTGLFKVTSDNALNEQTIELSRTQNYNNTTINYNSFVKLYIKRINLTKGPGEGGADSIAQVDGVCENIALPYRMGYLFKGYYTEEDGKGSLYYNENGKLQVRHTSFLNINTLYAKWEAVTYYVNLYKQLDKNEPVLYETIAVRYDQTIEREAISIGGYDYKHWLRDGQNAGNGKQVIRNWTAKHGDTIKLIAYYTKHSCVAEGTLITLADKTLKPVEQLDGTEKLLVWNLFTGNFDEAPILFIDNHGEAEYVLIELTFSDGTVVEVVDEHGFWDYDLNKYVYIDKNNANSFVGHSFSGHTENAHQNKVVTLTNVEIYNKTTFAYSPVTFKHLCYFVNGMLSMPAATESFTNIFEVDKQTMQYNKQAMEKDIATYGLFEYEKDFSELIPPQIFEAFNGSYLKVSIAKGITTMEEIFSLINRYSKFFENGGEK